MRVPIVMLCGAAGSGKDTVADFMVKGCGAVKIAQADPMKRLAAKLFGFSEETLWGPSERRNDLTRVTEGNWDETNTTSSDWVVGEFAEWPEEKQDELGAAIERWFGGFATNFGCGWRAKDNVTCRRVLQTLGTECGRAFSKNMWVDLALRNARALLEGGLCYSRSVGLRSVLESHSDCSPDNPPLVVITDGRFRNEILAVRAAGGATVKVVSPNSGLNGDAAKHSSETELDSIPHSWFDAVLVNKKEHGLEALEMASLSTMSRVLEQRPATVRTVDQSKLVIGDWRASVDE